MMYNIYLCPLDCVWQIGVVYDSYEQAYLEDRIKEHLLKMHNIDNLDEFRKHLDIIQYVKEKRNGLAV
jgi:predicted small metal-binding protein